MAKLYKILVFAKPHNTEQPLVSGMPWLAVLCPLLAGNVISEIQGYVCSGDYLSAESGDQKMVTDQEMLLQCDAPPNVPSEQAHDWNHGMPSLSSIVLFLFHSPISCGTKQKVLRCFEGGCIGVLPCDLGTLGNLNRQKSPWGTGNGSVWWLVTSSQEAGRADGLAIAPLYTQGFNEEPRQSHLQASLFLTLTILRSSSAKCVKGQGRCFTQAWFSALVVLKEAIS